MGDKTRADYGHNYKVFKPFKLNHVSNGKLDTLTIWQGSVIEVVGVLPGQRGDSNINIKLPNGEISTISTDAFDKLVHDGALEEDIEEIKLTGKKAPLRTSMQKKAYSELRRLAHECHPDDLKQFFEDHEKGLI